MKEMKRFISMVLCLVMILGMLPLGALRVNAAETVPLDALVVMSDLHIGTNKTDKKALVENVLGAIKKDYPTVSSVNSSGDMFSSNEDTKSGNASEVDGYIYQVYPGVDTNYVWTDHDRAATDIPMESRLVYGAGLDGTYGTKDDDNYYVYLLSMADMSTFTRYVSFYSNDEVTKHIGEFKTAVAGLDQCQVSRCRGCKRSLCYWYMVFCKDGLERQYGFREAVGA